MRFHRAAAMLSIVLAAGACDTPSPTGQTDDGALAPLSLARENAIPGHYIVLLEAPRSGAATDARIHATAASVGVTPRRVFARLNGFAAPLTDAQVAELRRNPRVRLIEQDRVFRVATTQTFTTLSLWGLDRIDEYTRPLSGSYTYTNTGSGVNVYVIDTGIFLGHTQFGGRAHAAFDAYRAGSNPAFATDANGHGTHVAGIIGATKWGAAKGVDLYSVRVLDASGTASTSAVVAGIEWVADNAIAPAVANLSLSGDTSTVLDEAVQELIDEGIFTSVASGNINVAACSLSPARVSGAFTVAASDSFDVRSSTSGYGSCIDAYAPGVYIGSAWYDTANPSDSTATKAMGGTSMSAAFVSGVAALYLEDNTSATPSTVAGWITTNASENKITSNPAGTPNLLLNKQEL